MNALYAFLSGLTGALGGTLLGFAICAALSEGRL